MIYNTEDIKRYVCCVFSFENFLWLFLIKCENVRIFIIDGDTCGENMNGIERN
jgi:hypothetical protein